MKRREFLTTGALAASGALLNSQVTFAGMANGRKPRLIFVILRGALDGLAAVPACGDPGYAELRGDLALERRAPPAAPYRSMAFSHCIRRSLSCSSPMRRVSSSCFTLSRALTGTDRTSMARTCWRRDIRNRMRSRPDG